MPHLQKYVVFSIFGLLAVGSVVARSRQADTVVVHGAVLHLSETVCDFGDIPRRGGDSSREIEFANTGDRPLVITRLVTSNSCLKASCSRRPLPPGGKGVIRIVYQPLKSEPGAFSRVIRIGSNAVAGETQLTVCGNSFEEPVPVRKVKVGKTRVKIK